MYQNQFKTPPASPQEPHHLCQKGAHRSKWRKAFAVVVTVAVLLLGAVSGTVAYLTAQKTVINTFAPSHVACKVQDTGAVQNTGDIAAYIRAKVVVTWVDSSETETGVTTVCSQTPEYSVEGTDWEKGSDGFYYYTKEVAVNGLTSSLKIESNAPEGYTVQIEIMADAIQSVGSRDNGTAAVMDAWKVDPKNPG